MLQNTNPGGVSASFSQKTCQFSKKNHPKEYCRRSFAELFFWRENGMHLQADMEQLRVIRRKKGLYD